MYNPSATDYDHLFKVTLVGDVGVGKSSMLVRFADDVYEESYISTVGIDFKIRTVELDKKVCKLQLWDTWGQHSFRKNDHYPFLGTHIYIICYSTTDHESFNKVKGYLEFIQERSPAACKILVGTKNDLSSKKVVDTRMAREFAEAAGIPHLETSAKTGDNIEAAFLTAASEVLAKHSRKKEKTPAPKAQLEQPTAPSLLSRIGSVFSRAESKAPDKDKAAAIPEPEKDLRIEHLIKQCEEAMSSKSMDYIRHVVDLLQTYQSSLPRNTQPEPSLTKYRRVLNERITILAKRESQYNAYKKERAGDSACRASTAAATSSPSRAGSVFAHQGSSLFSRNGPTNLEERGALNAANQASRGPRKLEGMFSHDPTTAVAAPAAAMTSQQVGMKEKSEVQKMLEEKGLTVEDFDLDTLRKDGDAADLELFFDMYSGHENLITDPVCITGDTTQTTFDRRTIEAIINGSNPSHPLSRENIKDCKIEPLKNRMALAGFAQLIDRVAMSKLADTASQASGANIGTFH